MAKFKYKEGDRVRLKAWVAPRRASVICALFEQGWVGIVENSRKCSKGVVVLLRHQHNPENPSAPFGQSFVYESDLELMPERQVHSVKDGKVMFKPDLYNRDAGIVASLNAPPSPLKLTTQVPEAKGQPGNQQVRIDKGLQLVQSQDIKDKNHAQDPL